MRQLLAFLNLIVTGRYLDYMIEDIVSAFGTVTRVLGLFQVDPSRLIAQIPVVSSTSASARIESWKLS